LPARIPGHATDGLGMRHGDAGPKYAAELGLVGIEQSAGGLSTLGSCLITRNVERVSTMYAEFSFVPPPSLEGSWLVTVGHAVQGLRRGSVVGPPCSYCTRGLLLLVGASRCTHPDGTRV
jgi:hypothetical protein